LFYVSAGERPPALAGILAALDEQHAPFAHEKRAHPHAETAKRHVSAGRTRGALAATGEFWS
jgi:hypothetical protein